MKILVDKEGKEAINKLVDDALRANGINVVAQACKVHQAIREDDVDESTDCHILKNQNLNEVI
jgi:hypothetical protein